MLTVRPDSENPARDQELANHGQAQQVLSVVSSHSPQHATGRCLGAGLVDCSSSGAIIF